MNHDLSLLQTFESRGYTVKEVHTFNEMTDLVRAGFRFQNIYSTGFWCLLGACLLLNIAAGGYFAYTGQLSISDYLGYFFRGSLPLLLLIPIHELIHGLVFRYYGARDVRYGFIPRYIIFYAVAHLQPVTLRQFTRIAVAPFLVISLLCIAGIIWLPVSLKAASAGLLLFHTICCAGDFGLCAYMYHDKDLLPVTFDDADNKQSYFLVKTTIN